MRPIFICIAIATFAWWQLPSELAAQTKNIVRPDFSGVWKMDRTRSESAMQEHPIGEVTVVALRLSVAIAVKAYVPAARPVTSSV